MEADIYYDDLGKDMRVESIPEDMLGLAREYRAAMIEAVAESDEHLFEKFCNEEEITTEEIKAAIRRETIENTIVPVVCGTSYRNKGVQKLLDAIVDYMPSPTDIPAVKGIKKATARQSGDVSSPSGTASNP